MSVTVWDANSPLTFKALPVVILNSPAVTDDRKGGAYTQFGGEAGDIVGLILFVIGFLWEAIADIQKVSRFLRYVITANR